MDRAKQKLKQDEARGAGERDEESIESRLRGELGAHAKDPPDHNCQSAL
jgi:hypothetical protein